MSQVRVGVIGVGGMGSFYADRVQKGEIPRAVLTAVCDADRSRLDRWSTVKTFTDAGELIESGEIDAVIICTPHYDHTPIGIAALKKGLHVLVDKPISVHKADAQKLVAAHKDPSQVFAAMFNQRTDGFFLKIKELIDSRALGEIRRANWIITSWFRSFAYYASSPWRATWAGEGGGVLLNQCPHQIDMLCWLLGMPVKVDARCHFGKYHDIEVEDEVTAYLEYPNGCTGIFITSTGEAPGTNRLEITGENGKVVFEHDKLVFYRNKQPMTEFSRTTSERFATPETEIIEYPGLDHGRQHLGVIENFVEAILDGKRLIAPAAEGLASVELANAMLMSEFEKRTVTLPLDPDAYAHRLEIKVKNSSYIKRKPATAPGVPPSDMSGSYR